MERLVQLVQLRADFVNTPVAVRAPAALHLPTEANIGSAVILMSAHCAGGMCRGM
jgi:hypothetical protein